MVVGVVGRRSIFACGPSENEEAARPASPVVQIATCTLAQRVSFFSDSRLSKGDYVAFDFAAEADDSRCESMGGRSERSILNFCGAQTRCPAGFDTMESAFEWAEWILRLEHSAVSVVLTRAFTCFTPIHRNLPLNSSQAHDAVISDDTLHISHAK